MWTFLSKSVIVGYVYKLAENPFTTLSQPSGSNYEKTLPEDSENKASIGLLCVYGAF